MLVRSQFGNSHQVVEALSFCTSVCNCYCNQQIKCPERGQMTSTRNELQPRASPTGGLSEMDCIMLFLHYFVTCLLMCVCSFKLIPGMAVMSRVSSYVQLQYCAGFLPGCNSAASLHAEERQFSLQSARVI